MAVRVIMPTGKKQETIVFTTTLFTSEDRLVLAPLQNLTSHFFRENYCRFFPDTLDYAITPFISASSETNSPKSRIFDDIRQSYGQSIHIVPQILGNNAEYILSAARIIESMGYREINLNMGCPKREITSHNRGCGMLKDRKLIADTLERLFKETKLLVSLKVRLGMQSDKELDSLTDLFNSFPIKEICIHPRTALQQYEGKPDLDAFERISRKLKTQIVYNGDIFSAQDFSALKMRFPQITKWMLGRGVLMNPFLASEIRCIPADKNMFPSYFKGLIDSYAKSLTVYNEATVLNKVKELYRYTSKGLHLDADAVLHCNNLSEAENIILSQSFL